MHDRVMLQLISCHLLERLSFQLCWSPTDFTGAPPECGAPTDCAEAQITVPEPCLTVLEAYLGMQPT